LILNKKNYSLVATLIISDLTLKSKSESLDSLNPTINRVLDHGNGSEPLYTENKTEFGMSFSVDAVLQLQSSFRSTWRIEKTK
jgi:hypothetical protein